MAAPIQSLAKCEVRFLNANGERPPEIYAQIVAVYGNVTNWQTVMKWCREFSEGRTDVHDWQRRCKKLWRGSKGRRQTSVTQGYRSWFPRL